MPKTWSRIIKILSISLFSILVALLVLVNVLAKKLVQEESDMQAALNASGQELSIQTNTMEIDSLGSIRYARQLAHALAGAASVEFERLYGHLPESDDKAFVRGLPTWVFERT